MRTSILTVSAVVALALTGCGDGTDDAGAGAATTVASESAAETPPGPEETADTAADPSDACALVSESDVEAAYGEAAPLDGPRAGQNTENDLEFTSANCGWESAVLEVHLEFSVASDYPNGKLLCPPLSSLGDEATPVQGVGDSASFAGREFNEVEGTLRVCTEAATFDIEAEAPTGSRDLDTLSKQHVALAGVVLGNLPS